MKRPAFQFYPADWRKDLALRACSIAARGLWIEILCAAHESDDYGHLTVNGIAMTVGQIASNVGAPTALVGKLLAELETAGVLSRDGKGAVFSRRMERDERLRSIRSDCGKLGAEHGAKGAEHGVKGGRPPKEITGQITPQNTGQETPQETPQETGQKPPPSVSSSSSSSNEQRSELPTETRPRAPGNGLGQKIAHENQKRPPPNWRRDPDAAAAYGRELGINPLPGETTDQYVARIDQEIAQRKRNAA